MRCHAGLPVARRLVLCAWCTWLLGGVALAQQPPVGLSPTREPVFSVRLFQSFDDQTRPAVTLLQDGNDGSFARTGLRAEVTRTYSRKRSSLSVGGAAQFSHRAEAGRWLADEEWAAVGVQLQLSRLLSLSLSQRAGYSEAFTAQSANTAQAVASGALIDVADPLTRGASFTASSATSLSRILTRRSSVLLAYAFNRTANAGGGVVVGNHRLGAALDRKITGDWSVQAGYASAWGVTTSAPGHTSAYRHEFDIRTAYRLPFWRGTVLSAGLAPGFLGARTDVPNPLGFADAASGGAFAMQGRAGVEHAFGSLTRVGFTYERMTSFPPGSTRPISADVMTWRGSGQLSRRLAAQFSVSSSRARHSASSVSAWARADTRLSDAAGLYVEYAHDARANARRLSWEPGLDRNYTYRSLRVGVNLDFGLSGLSRRKT